MTEMVIALLMIIIMVVASKTGTLTGIIQDVISTNTI